ncbi:MAG: response regulator transcription factor [Burkholderiaceae bacterium]
MRVLLVEDDSMIGQAVMKSLKDHSYAVDWVQDGQAALDTMRLHAYDLVLLDLGLPKRDGMDVLRTIRAHNDPVPVLIVTARDAVSERVSGLDLGADDFLSKPFKMVELLARMRAVARRKSGNTGNPVLSNGVVSLDPSSRTLLFNEHAAVLTAKEYAIMRALLIRPGAILSKDRLEEMVYGWNEEVESNAIDFLIHGIRKKVGAAVIKNIRGAGWMVAKSL